MRSPAPLQRLSPAQGLACRAGLLTGPQLGVSTGLPLILRCTNLASLASPVLSPQPAQNPQGFHRTGGCFKSTALPVSDEEEPPPSSQALLLQGNPTWLHLSRGLTCWVTLPPSPGARSCQDVHQGLGQGRLQHQGLLFPVALVSPRQGEGSHGQLHSHQGRRLALPSPRPSAASWLGLCMVSFHRWQPERPHLALRGPSEPGAQPPPRVTHRPSPWASVALFPWAGPLRAAPRWCTAASYVWPGPHQLQL